MLLNKLIFMAFLSIRRSIFGADSIFLPDGREIPDLPRIEGTAETEFGVVNKPFHHLARACVRRRSHGQSSGR